MIRARIPPLVSRDGLDPDGQAAWDEIARDRGTPSGPFSVLLHSPELAARTGRLGAYLRFHSPLPPAIHYLVALVVAKHFDCEYEWQVNERAGRAAGLAEATLAAVRDGTTEAMLPEEDALVLHCVSALVAGRRLDDDLFAAALARYGRGRLVDLVATAGYYAQIAIVLNAFEVRAAVSAGNDERVPGGAAAGARAPSRPSPRPRP